MEQRTHGTFLTREKNVLQAAFLMAHEIPKAVPNPSVPKPRVAPLEGLQTPL